MLANVPKPGRDFQALCRYLLEGAGGGKSSKHRVAWTMTRNLTSSNAMTAAKIMTATAAASVRTVKPVYHLIVSWNAAEHADRTTMEKVIATTLAEMGLSEHQAVIVAHADTKNPHVHLAINRVHPDTGTAWSTKHDYRRLERSMFRQAQSLGFSAVPGRHNKARKQPAPRIRSRGAMMLVRKDRAALTPWSRAEAAPKAAIAAHVLTNARSWQEVSSGLNASGLEIVPKGQGLVIVDIKRTGYLKLSALPPTLRKSSLEQRFDEPFSQFMSLQQSFEQAPPEHIPAAP